MLEQEALWLSSVMKERGSQKLSPMLNVGSGSRKYRTQLQPRIGRTLDSFTHGGGQLIHTDIQAVEGVDVVGNIADPKFAASLQTLSVAAVLCTNVLEHLPELESVTQSLSALVGTGGYLIVTVPNRYPYHADPIDNGFRPTPQELASMFDGFVVEEANEIHCGTFADSLGRDPKGAILWFFRLFLPFYRTRGWRTAVAKIPWLFRDYVVAGVVLRKADEA